jgi:hypothetical protein
VRGRVTAVYGKVKERARLYGMSWDAVVNSKQWAGRPLLGFGTDAMVCAHPQLAQPVRTKQI